MHFDNSVTERIPIPNNILSKKSELIKLSNRITESKNKNFNADVSELEHQIDQIFYELYTLSDEEIAIIENT
jgi:hypothetical protein